MKVEFLTTVDCRFVDGVQWEITAPFIAVVDPDTPTQRLIRVPSGFKTDWASIPRLPLIYLRFANRAHRPALLHDYLHSLGGNQEDRLFSDAVFLHGMLGTGIDPIDANAMFLAVRQFGGKHFRRDPLPHS